MSGTVAAQVAAPWFAYGLRRGAAPIRFCEAVPLPSRSDYSGADRDYSQTSAVRVIADMG